jgi:hypothetical protein
VSLDENPHYEALSYTCGDPKVTVPIQLRSGDQGSIAQVKTDALSDNSLGLCTVTSFDLGLVMPPAIKTAIAAVELPTEGVSGLSPSAKKGVYAQWPVTTNLEAALRYLRHESMVPILWIDAICIDQSSIEERKHQVPLMKTIYSNATAVRVWLGNPTTGNDDAIIILRELGQGVPLQEIELQGCLVNDNDLQPIIELMTRPWWDRTWVQQELLLAKRALFHCGFSYFEWNDMPSMDHFNSLMDSAMKSLRFNEDILDDLIDSFDSSTRIQNMAETHQESGKTDEDVITILAHGRLCFNSDERDSIYGFLGIMSENIAKKIRPDYNMSVADVFQDAATQLSVCSQSLILFSLTQYATVKSSRTPTWVPNWYALRGLEAIEWSNRARRLTQHDYFSACAERTMKFENVGRGLLNLSGTKLDHVQTKGSVGSPSDSTLEDVLKQHREWRLLCGLDIHDRSCYIGGGKASDAYWRTLINDIYIGVGELRRRCQTKDHRAHLEWLHELKIRLHRTGKVILPTHFTFLLPKPASAVDFSSPRRVTLELGQLNLKREMKSIFSPAGSTPLLYGRFPNHGQILSN